MRTAESSADPAGREGAASAGVLLLSSGETRKHNELLETREDNSITISSRGYDMGK